MQNSQKKSREFSNPFTTTWHLTKEYAAYASLGEDCPRSEIAGDSSSALLHCLWNCCYAVCEMKADLMRSGRAPWQADWSPTILLFNGLYKVLSPSLDTSIWLNKGVSGNLSMTLQSSLLALNLAMEQMIQMTNASIVSVDDVKKRFSLIEQLWTIRTLRVREEEKEPPAEDSRGDRSIDNLALSSIWTLLRSVISTFLSPNEDNKKLIYNKRKYLERMRDGENWVFQSCWEVCKVLGERATSKIWCPDTEDDLYFHAYASTEEATISGSEGGGADSNAEFEIKFPPSADWDLGVERPEEPQPSQDSWEHGPCVSSDTHTGGFTTFRNTALRVGLPTEEWSTLGTDWYDDQTNWPARPGSPAPQDQGGNNNAGSTTTLDEPTTPCPTCSNISPSDIEAIHYIRLRILVLRAAIAHGWSSTNEKSFKEYLRVMPATSFGETKAMKVLFHTYRRIMLASKDSIKDRADKFILEATVEQVQAAVEWKTKEGKHVFLKDLFAYVVGVDLERVDFLTDRLRKKLITTSTGGLPK